MRFALGLGVTTLSLSATLLAAPESDYSLKDTRKLAYDYGKCVVGRHHAAASEAILRNISNREIMRNYAVLVDGLCLVRSTHSGAKMSFPGDLYRYALADALFAREVASAPVPDLSNVPPLERPARPEPAPLAPNASKADRNRYQQAFKDFTEAEAFRALSAVGECVVRLNTAGAKALLLASPETNGETAAFNALRPTLAQCLPEGRTLTLGKLALRGTIAVNYYRLARAVKPLAAR